MDEGHPDFKYLRDWAEDTVCDFDDEYIFSKGGEEEAIESIKKTSYTSQIC